MPRSNRTRSSQSSADPAHLNRRSSRSVAFFLLAPRRRETDLEIVAWLALSPRSADRRSGIIAWRFGPTHLGRCDRRAQHVWTWGFRTGTRPELPHAGPSIQKAHANSPNYAYLWPGEVQERRRSGRRIFVHPSRPSCRSRLLRNGRLRHRCADHDPSLHRSGMD